MNIYRGDSATLYLTVTDSDGEAFDLTGYTIKFTATGRVTISKTSAVGGGIEITNAAGGLATITLLTTDTATVGEYSYDVEISKDANVYTVILSKFWIINDITP